MEQNPYKVLGVPENATDDEIKKAYRDLVRKYHPDKYGDNPLADVAAEKMKEINAAYDQITKDRKAGVHTSYGNASSGYNNYNGYGGNSYGGSTYSGASYNYGNSRFADIRRLIQQNRIAEAEELLDGVAEAQRTAEWYFLKGHIYYSRGWLNEAMNHFTIAYKMEPNNAEYTSAYQQCAYRRQYGTSRGYGNGENPMTYCNFDLCDCCTSLICLNMCCRGGGGCC